MINFTINEQSNNYTNKDILNYDYANVLSHKIHKNKQIKEDSSYIYGRYIHKLFSLHERLMK